MLASLAVLLLSAPPLVELRLEPQSQQANALVAAAGLELGAPCEAEAVREAVELLFATGRYEDVRVAATETESGTALVIRTVPAPLLQDVLLEGRERPLSPARIRSLTRLRAGEALWPERLERAAQDVALFLAGGGWLEARAQAHARRLPTAGAQAVFTLSPGPRARVGRAEVHVATAGLAPLALQALVAPASGQPFKRERAKAAAERMRRQLVTLGSWRAQVQVRETYDPASARVDLDFDVRGGPAVRVEYRGLAPPAGLRRGIERLLREGALSADVVAEGAERIESALRAMGHREARAAAREEAQPWGLKLIYEIQPGPQARVASVALPGSEDVQPPLRVALQTQPDRPFQEDLLERDARALRDALLERGYTRATVEPEVAFGAGRLPVAFRVRPGTRTLVADAGVALRNAVTLSADQAPPALRLRAGTPYRERELALDRNALLAAYRNAGYRQVQVVPQVGFSEDRSEASVRLLVDPGERTLLGSLVVAGLQDTRPAVVQRELLIRPGQPLGTQRLLDSQRRLSALGLFQRVSLRELEPDSGERRNVLVTVEEGPRTTLAYGLGFAEREGARASLELTRRNLFGLDRTLTLFGRYGTRANRAFASFREPYLFGRRQELFLTGFREEENREPFSFIRLGGLVQTARALGPRTSLILRYAFQRSNLFRLAVPLDEIDRQFQSSTNSGPSLSVLHDTRDDPIDPRRGRFLGADLQLSLRLLRGDRFVKSYLQGATYVPLGPRLLLALNARLGLGATYGHDSPGRLPLPDRFFAGGDFSVRGFATDFVGPLAATPAGRLVPTGGNALLLGSAELRVDCTRAVALAAFADTGNVFPEVRDLDLAELRLSAGLGLRYKSALGPLRLDYGWKLDRRSGESPGHLHVTIGHAF